jgi:hypothetical protein
MGGSETILAEAATPAQVNSSTGSGLAIILSRLRVWRCTHSKIKGGL